MSGRIEFKEAISGRKCLCILTKFGRNKPRAAPSVYKLVRGTITKSHPQYEQTLKRPEYQGFAQKQHKISGETCLRWTCYKVENLSKTDKFLSSNAFSY